MHEMVCSRLDLDYSTSMISRFMANPGMAYWEALKWTLRYLKGSTRLVLLFQKQTNTMQPVAGFVDSDFAGNLDTRNSLTGFVFTMFGKIICWNTILQYVLCSVSLNNQC